MPDYEYSEYDESNDANLRQAPPLPLEINTDIADTDEETDTTSCPGGELDACKRDKLTLRQNSKTKCHSEIYQKFQSIKSD